MHGYHSDDGKDDNKNDDVDEYNDDDSNFIESLPVTARVLPSPILSMVGRPLHLPNCSTLDGIVRSYHTEKCGMG